MKYERVLFDLDGTLSDPSEGITRCIDYAMKKLELPCPALNDLETHIGPPLIETFAELGVPAPRLEVAVDLFRERFSTVGITENKLFEGVTPLLDLLQNSGMEIMLATSKPMEFAERILDQFGLTSYFTEIAGATMDGSRLHKADVISYALRDSSSELAVMVGDRKHDLIGASIHGMAAIGVTWGFGSLEELQAERPSAIVNSFDELSRELLT